jgi:hypothetical protein
MWQMVVVATLRSSLCFVEATADDSILDTVMMLPGFVRRSGEL